MIIFDNFLEDPQARRDLALLSKFETIEATGVEFPGIARLSTHDSKRLKSYVPHETCTEFFRLTREGDILPTYIHNDAAMARWTGILYLNKAPVGGTAFWQHRGTKTTRPSPTHNIEKLREDGLHQERWELRHVVEMKWNRLVLFDARLWHSPFPRSGWGSSPSDGRLIQVYFMA